MVKTKWIAQGLMGACLLLTGTHADAATYYFSTSGNNTNGDGTQAAPFYSLCGPWAGSGCATGENKISRSQIAVNPGDTFLFKRGDEWVGMNAVWTINATGAPGNPLTFGAWGDPNLPRPIFRGAQTAFELGKDNWTNVTGTPIWYTTGISVWPNMAAQEDTAPGGPSLYGAWSVQGVDNTNGWTSNQSMVRGTYFYDSSTQRFYVWRSDDLKPDHAAGRDVYIGVAPNDGTDRFVKVNRGSAGGSSDPKYVGQHYIFRDLHVKMSRGYGFSTSYPNTQYINCLSELNSMEGFLFDRRRFGAPLPGSKDSVMRNSVSRRNNLKQGTGAGQGITIESENVWIYDSESYENAWAGIDFLDYHANTKSDGGGVVNCKVHNNGIQPVSQHNYDPNIYIDGGSNITIRDSQVWGAGVDPRGVKTRLKTNSGIAIDVEGAGFSVGRRPTNIKVINTLSYGNMGPAVKMGAINGSQTAVEALSNIQLIGNTLERERGDSDIKGYYNQNTTDYGIRAFHFKNVSSGLVFKNNLVIAMNTVRAPVFGSKSMIDKGKSVADFDNNIYYCPGCNYNVNGSSSAGGFFSYNYIENLTMDQWLNVGDIASMRRDTALPKSIVTANPLLTLASLSAFDARLQPGSPALGAANPSAFPVLTPALSGTTSPAGVEDIPYNDLGYHYPLTGAAPPPPPADTQAPTAPSSLTALQSSSQVALAWLASTDNVAVAGYRIFDGTNLLGTTTSLGYTLASAVPGQTYNFLVRAYDAVNNTSSPSNTVTLTVGAPSSDTTPPTAPTGLTAVVSSTQVTLSWTASTDNVGVVGYEIMNNGLLLGTSVSTSFVHNTTAGTTYNYTVRAGDASNNMSAFSSIVTTTIPPSSGSVPTAPSNLVGNYVSGQAQLTWSPSTNHNGYNVYRNDVYRKTVNASATSTYDSSVTAGQTYRYKVQAYDASNDLSAFTNEVSITIPGGTADTTAPSAPTSLAASLSGTTANLTWIASTDNVGVTGYQVFQGAVLSGTTTSLNYSVNGLTQGQTHIFTARALDAAGNVSASSNSASVTVLPAADTTAPSAPTSLAASLSGTTANLTWIASTDNVGVTGYQVFQGAVLSGTTTSLNYSVNGLTQGQTHIFTARALDAAGNVSASSNSASVTVPVPGPLAPADLIAMMSGSSVYVAWTSSTNAIGYLLFRNGTSLQNTTSASLTDSAVSQGQSYTYNVQAYDSANVYSTFSNSMSITVPDTISPSVPSGFTAALSGTQVTLSWSASTDNVGVTGYDILNNGALIGSSSTTSFVHNGTAGSTYNYTVRSKDAAGNISAQSGTATITIPAANTSSATAPSNLVGSYVSNQVQLSWSPSTNHNGYNVYRNDVYYRTVSRTATSNNDTNVTIGQTYRYKVQAYDASNRLTAFTNEVSITIPGGTADTTAPSAPSSLTASLSGSTANLSWSASTDNVAVTGYRVFEGATQRGTTTSLTFAVTGLSVGSHTFTVRAVDAAINLSSSSNSASVTVPPAADTTAPSAPSSLTASLSGSTANLSWSASTDNVAVTGYRVFEGATQRGTTTSLTFAVTGLSVGSHTFTVRAVDAAINLSSSSNSASVTVPPAADTTAPSAPSSLTASLSGSTANLSWSASTDNVAVTGYRIFNGAAQIGTTSSLTYSVTGLSVGSHTFTVRAVDAAGNVSTDSNASSVTVASALPPPPAPANFRINVDASGNVTLSWNASSGAAGYRVFRNDVAVIAIPGLTATEHPGPGIWRYKVQAYSNNGDSAFSNEITIQTNR